MTLPFRTARSSVVSPWIAAPLGLWLSGCGGAEAPPVAANQPAKPRLLAPELLAEPPAALRPWRVTNTSYRPSVEGLNQGGVFRLPHDAQAERAAPSVGAFFPEHVPPTMAREPVATHVAMVDPSAEDAEESGPQLTAPSELQADELQDLQPLSVQSGTPPLSTPEAIDPSATSSWPRRGGVTETLDEPAVKPTPVPWADSAAAPNPAMRAVAERSAAQVRSGFALANRNALYSARTEFVSALRGIAQALDAQAGGQKHTRALAAGLRALEESDDFIPVGTQIESELNLERLRLVHHTPILKEAELDELTSLEARRRYYTYAQEQLALAAGRERAGSMALYGLAKVQLVMAEQNPVRHTGAAPKAMALQQAALMVDGSNYLAANEMGVLLAKFGQFPQAKAVLLHSVQQTPMPTSWHNLAIVHTHLGEHQLAAAAEQEARVMAQHSQTSQMLGEQSRVVWTDAASFARSAPGGAEMQLHTPPAAPTAARPQATKVR